MAFFVIEISPSSSVRDVNDTPAPLRLLVISEINNPDWISVPLVGYKHAAALAKLHQVTLVTRAENQQAISRRNAGFIDVVGLAFGIWDRLFDWVVDHIFAGDQSRQALTAVRIPFYLQFEARIWRLYKKRLLAGEFDVVIRLTPVSPVIPSLLPKRLKKIGVPFVLGPINGGLPWPQGYEQAEKQKEWVSNLRKLYRLVPYSGSMYEHASAVVVGSSQTWSEQQAHHERLFFLPENGIDEALVQPRALIDDTAPLRLVFVGRLVPYKACDLALKAAAPLILKGRAQFTVIGFGEQRENFEQLCVELGIAAHVEFTGELPHPETLNRLRQCDVLVFPSIREFGGGVVFEALACGAVPLISDYGGPGDIVEESRGIRVPMSDEATALKLFTSTLEALDADRPRLRALAIEGQRYARESLGWANKAQQMTRIFEWCLGRGAKPQMLPPERTRAV